MQTVGQPRGPKQLGNRADIVAAIESHDHSRVVTSLEACEQLRELAGKRFYCVPLGGMEYSPPLTADWLLEQSRTTTADAALEAFAHVALKRVVDVDHVALIYGVVVDKPYELGRGFSIEPARVRETAQRHRPADEMQWVKDWAHDTLLVRRNREKVRILGTDEHATSEEVWWHTESRGRELDEVLGVLSLAVSNPVFHGVTWADVAGPFWLQRGTSTRTEGQMPASARLRANEEQISVAKRLLDKLHELGHHRDAVRVALSRYRMAATPWDVKRSAVDIAVAYEGLLVSEKQAEATTLTLCLRGAWLLGTVAEARLETFRMLQKLYGIRSDLVHSGGRNWGVGKSGKWSISDVRENEALVLQSIRQFEQLAKRLIEGGYPSSWTKVILGFDTDNQG